MSSYLAYVLAIYDKLALSTVAQYSYDSFG